MRAFVYKRTLSGVCPVALLLLTSLLAGCGGVAGSGGGGGGGGSISSIAVSGPTYAQAGVCGNFTATVSGSGNYDHSVHWLVNGVVGGSPVDGLISSSGNYCAPAQLPANNVVTITAIANGDASKSAGTTTRVVAITITPNQVQMYLGASQQFSATVSGALSNVITWEVNGIAGGNATVGTISNSGWYTAPAQMTNLGITIAAALAEAPTVAAIANLSLAAQIVITPQNPQITFGSSQQFTATIGGVVTQVTWAAAYGSISTSGLYTATGAQTPDTIRASALNANGTTSVQVLARAPVITSISPQPATAGDQITLNGSNLNPIATVAFVDSAGGQIPVTGVVNGGTSVTVTVPQGSVSGPLSVTSAQGGLAPVRSNVLQFQRLARLRIRTPKKDLSAGEPVTLKYAMLGDATPRGVTFTADVGSISGATYTAPASIASDSFAHIQGCITGTQSCDTLMLGLHPFRISPDIPLVGLGQSLPLAAWLGSGPAGASFNLMAGGGSVTSGGLYTAGTQTQDGGPAIISAVSSGVTERASIGVTGAFPGLVNRLYDYADEHDPNFSGSFVYGMAVYNNRLYLASSNHVGAYTDSYFYIDVYDLSDPLHPAWVTAVESNSIGPLFSVGPYLYSYANVDLAVPGYPNTITVYSVQSGVPVLTARSQVPQWWSISHNQGVLTLLPSSGTVGRSSQDVLMYDVTGGTIVSTVLSVPLPSHANYYLPDTTLRAGNRLFVSTTDNDGSTGDILTYDISISPPTLLGEAIGERSLAFYASGNLLFGALGGMVFYDISSSLPQRLAHIDGINAELLRGTELVATTAQQGCELLDVGSPQNPRVTATLFSGVVQPCGWPAWVGNYLYVSEYVGGLAIYDVSQGGGPLRQGRLYGGGVSWSDAYDLRMQSPYLYVGAATSLGATLSVFDTTTSPPTRIGQYFDPTQQGSALESSGNYLYFGMSSNTAVIDVTQPASPSLVSILSMPAISLAKSNSTLYAGTANNTLAIVNISNPTQPQFSGSLNLPGLPVRLSVANNRLFVAADTAGLFIYDITAPASPVLLSRYAGFVAVSDVAIAGNTAFVAADADGLGILDISNPAQPVLISKTSVGNIDPFYPESPVNQALSVVIHNNAVYVGTLADNGTIVGLDCTNLAAPRVVSLFAAGDFILTWVRSMLFDGNEMYVGGSLGFTYPVEPVDMTQPWNYINQYYPPLALQNPAPPYAARRAVSNVNLKQPSGPVDRYYSPRN